jgi:hypothetical protein
MLLLGCTRRSQFCVVDRLPLLGAASIGTTKFCLAHANSAKQQGYAGARWAKDDRSIGTRKPFARRHTLLIWQQPHPMSLYAELAYSEQTGKRRRSKNIRRSSNETARCGWQTTRILMRRRIDTSSDRTFISGSMISPGARIHGERYVRAGVLAVRIEHGKRVAGKTRITSCRQGGMTIVAKLSQNYP